MLRISIHAGSLNTTTRFNLLAWLDIGYDKLDAYADYKTLLYQAGTGAMAPAPITKYPRWSSSLWDLTARALALGLREDDENVTEEMPFYTPAVKRGAFVNKLSALIDHIPPAGEERRRTLATAELAQVGRTRGLYTATFNEHTRTRNVTQPFTFRPERVRPAELMLHACLMHLHGKAALPTRPMLCVPTAIMVGGIPFVQIHDLLEPAKTCFVHFLHHIGEPPIVHKTAALGIAPEQLYVRFLREVV